MAVILEFFNLIIRRDRIEALLPGGWPQYLAEYGDPLPFWADDDLVRWGAMSSADIKRLVEHWTNRGLVSNLDRQQGTSADMVVHACYAESSIEGCDWLATTDENTACFVGTRQKPDRPQIRSSWSDELVRLSTEFILQLLATPPNRRAPLPLKNWNGKFALLNIDMEARACLVAIDRETPNCYAYARIEDLLNAGWAID